MNARVKHIWAATVVAPLVLMPIESLAQDVNVRNLEQFSCKDVMRQSGSQRENAIAFLHGFILGRSGEMEFNLEEFAEQTDAFVDRCLDNPSDGALDSMTKVKS